MGQRCSSLGYSRSPTKHDVIFTSLRDGGPRRGSGGVKPIDIKRYKSSVAAARKHIRRLERFIQEAELLTYPYLDSTLENLVRRATQSLGSNSVAKADLYLQCLKMCPSRTRIVFRNFCLYTSNRDILEELLSRGRPVLDIYVHVFVVPETVRESCDLSQCALMSDSDKKAAMLRVSDLLFGSLMPLEEPYITVCHCCNPESAYQEVLENTRVEQLILRIMQASNLSATLAVGYFLTNYYFLTASNPKGLLRVFKCLVALGFDPSPTLQSVQHMEGYRACVDYWRRQPQLALKHLARQAVRDAITTNVVHAAPRLDLPASLQSYLLLEDLLAVGEDGEASAEAAQ